MTESATRTVRLGAKEGFELSAGFGNVTITGVSGDSVKIDTLKRVRHQDRDAGRAILSSVIIRIIERGGLVEALTEVTGGRERGRQEIFVDYNVSLPARASVSLKTFGNGTIRIVNVKGEIRAEAPSGDMVLMSVGRVRKAKMFGGNITITNAEGEEVIAETLGGTLVASNLKARTIELGTVNGNLIVTDALCDRCALKSVSGDIEFSGPLTMGGRYELQSNSGDVRLIPTGNPSFDLEARSIDGRLRSDFQPLKPNPTAPTQRGILRGSYGEGGGAILSLTSFTGNVSVVRR